MAPCVVFLWVQSHLCRLFWDAAGEAAATSTIPGQKVGKGGVCDHSTLGGVSPTTPCISVLDVQLRHTLDSPGGFNLPVAGLKMFWDNLA